MRTGAGIAARPALYVEVTMGSLTIVSNEIPVASAARVGIGGPVGSGKTALIEALIPELQRRGIDFAVITNDLLTKEDAERRSPSTPIHPAPASTVPTLPPPPP